MAIDDLKIKEAEEIDKIRESRKNLEKAVASLPEIEQKFDRLVSEICEGPDCLKQKVEDKFGLIDEKIKKIEEKQSDLVCDKCGYVGIQPLTSFCPNCSAPIYEWNDDDGKPIPGWRHWEKRNVYDNLPFLK